MKWKETTLVVSSKLPRTFLSGKIANSISGDARKDKDKGIIDFPNDPSDICYSLEKGRRSWSAASHFHRKICFDISRAGYSSWFRNEYCACRSILQSFGASATGRNKRL